jgi:hypothetical protein
MNLVDGGTTMHKLNLVLDDLRVESFDTTAPVRENGTVFGEQCTCYTQCTCPGCPTCNNITCPNTCAYTCDDNTCPYTCGGGCASGTGCGGVNTQLIATCHCHEM